MSGVHTAMTNTRNTPIEALERAFPMRVLRYRLRRGQRRRRARAWRRGDRARPVDARGRDGVADHRAAGVAAVGPGRRRAGCGGRELAAARRRRVTSDAAAGQVHDPAGGGRRAADADAGRRRMGSTARSGRWAHGVGWLGRGGCSDRGLRRVVAGAVRDRAGKDRRRARPGARVAIEHVGSTVGAGSGGEADRRHLCRCRRSR